MWLEGLAVIGGYTLCVAVYVTFLHLKSLFTGKMPDIVKGDTIALSYVAIAVVLFVGTQARPNPCPTPEEEMQAIDRDYLDDEPRDFIR
jgi:hypothetical protein